jgi:hypothetical protein
MADQKPPESPPRGIRVTGSLAIAPAKEKKK